MRNAEHLLEVLRQVRPLQQYTAKVIASALSETEVTLPIRAVLEQLDASGPSTVPQLARSLLVPRQVVQRLADSANEIGLVEYVPNPAHQRSRLLRLTSAGRDMFDALLEQEMAMVAPLAATFSEEDIEACARVIAALTEGMREVAQRLDEE